MFIHDSHNSKYYYTVNEVMKKIPCWLLSKEKQYSLLAQDLTLVI